MVKAGEIFKGNGLFWLVLGRLFGKLGNLKMCEVYLVLGYKMGGVSLTAATPRSIFFCFLFLCILVLASGKEENRHFHVLQDF